MGGNHVLGEERKYCCISSEMHHSSNGEQKAMVIPDYLAKIVGM